MAPDTATVDLMFFPTEVLEMILPLALPSKSGADLKQLRLMNKELSLFVEPYLFRLVCFSKASKNFQAWKNMTNPSNPLRHHVKHICIDSTVFIHKITKSEYCRRLARHLEENFSQIPAPPHGESQIYTWRNLFFDLHHAERKTRLLPGDRELLWNGYKDYLRLAQSQNELGPDGVYQALATGIPFLARLAEFSFITQWQVEAPGIRRWNESDGSHGAWEGGTFKMPGPIARQHPVLRLPPQCTRSWSEDGVSLLTYEFLAVTRVVRDLNLNLRELIYTKHNSTLYSSTPNLESLHSLRNVGLPIEAFSLRQPAENRVTIGELLTSSPDAFIHLQKLELTINPPLRATTNFQPMYIGPGEPGCLSDLLHSVPHLSTLILRGQSYDAEDANSEHVNAIFGILEMVLESFVLSFFGDHIAPSVFQYHINRREVLCVSNVPSHLKLRHLELSGFQGSGGGLISLLRRFAPTLEILTLHEISLAGDLVQWPQVLDTMRKIFSRRICPLELSLGFDDEEYFRLALHFEMLAEYGGEDDYTEATKREQVQRIERFVTSAEADLQHPDYFVPLIRGRQSA